VWLCLAAPQAQSAVSHMINVEHAKAKVAERAIQEAEAVGGHQGLDVDPDGKGIHPVVRVACRRVAGHVARCPWLALLYVGGEREAAAFACRGIARVRLVGRQLRFDPGSDPYQVPGHGRCFF
jgi:hypothetical protein